MAGSKAHTHGFCLSTECPAIDSSNVCMSVHVWVVECVCVCMGVSVGVCVERVPNDG